MSIKSARHLPSTSGIYWIRNQVNYKYYVGSAKSFAQRWGDHLRDLRNNRHYNKRLQNSWNKHGEVAFEFEVLVDCTEEELIPLEQSYIDDLDATNPEKGYNICAVAGNCSGREVTCETRTKIRAALIGVTLTEESLRKRTEIQRPLLIARNKSTKHQANVHASMCGHEVTQETRDKISFTLTGRGLSEAHKKSITVALRRPGMQERASKLTKEKWEQLTPQQQADRVAPMKGKSPKGSDHYMAVLTAEIVREARELRSIDPKTWSFRNLQQRYGCGFITIYKAVTGKTWAHL